MEFKEGLDVEDGRLDSADRSGSTLDGLCGCHHGRTHLLEDNEESELEYGLPTRDRAPLNVGKEAIAA